MATVECIAPRPAPPSQIEGRPETEVKHPGVVEFAPDSPNSQIARPFLSPTNNSGNGGFVYDGVRAGRDVRAGLSRRSAAVTALPMEDICFYVKEVDNTRLRRKVDPADKSMMRNLVILGVFAVLFCLTSFGPVAAKRQSGYRLRSLNNQYQKLQVVNSQLKDRRAKLSNVHRVQGLARARGLSAAPPERYAWQDRTIRPSSGGSELARNQPTPQP